MAQTIHLRIKIDGTDIVGESERTTLDREDTIQCASFTYQLVAPRDAATGKLAGRRQHGPVTITKRIDQTTPRLLKALCKSEPVNEALFMFYRPAATSGGAEEKYYSVKLKNGSITGIRQYGEQTVVAGQAEVLMMEEISFVFQTITWTHELNGATHSDSQKN